MFKTVYYNFQYNILNFYNLNIDMKDIVYSDVQTYFHWSHSNDFCPLTTNKQETVSISRVGKCIFSSQKRKLS